MNKQLKLFNFRKKLIDGWIGVAHRTLSETSPFGGSEAEQLAYLRHFLFESDELEQLLGIKKNESNI